MINDILEVFKQKYSESGDKLILGNYTLKEGLYIKINQDKKVEYFLVKKENRELNFTDINDNLNNKAYEWFKERDYYSNYLNSNKSFYDKKIHNINYLSFFVKIDSFISSDSKKLLSKDAIRGQYLSLLNYKKFTKPKEKEVLKLYKNKLNKCTRKKDVVKKYKFIEKNIQNIVEVAKQNGVTNYIKIFFDETIEKYKQESEFYYSIKIFNDIAYSKEVENKIYGLSDFNMGLNSKKPYLEHKTRKLPPPFMLLKDDALLIKKFSDWLKFQDLKNKFPLSSDFFLNRNFKEKDIVIDFDFIPVKINNINEHFKTIYVNNYLKVKVNDKFIEDIQLNKLWELEDIIDKIFYNKQLKFNYFRDNKDIKVSGFLSKELQKLLFITKNAMVNYFIKNDVRAFYQVVKKYGTAFVLDNLRNGRGIKAKEALNLKFAILEHQGEKIMDIEKMLITIKNRLEEKGNYKELERNEFLFLAGQWAYYLLSQSKSRDKTFSLAEHYFRAKNMNRLKSALRNDLKKYRHAIHREYAKTRKIIALVKNYTDDTKKFTDEEQDIFLIGFTVDNILYEEKK